jgi:peptidoglycan-N-acetylglucosamine deacetylase
VTRPNFAMILVMAMLLAMTVATRAEMDLAASPAAMPSQDDQPACASDGSVLGLSRVVEIDSAGGPEFGGSHGGKVDFLNDREVVLTFDDGPLRAYTTAVLKALAEHCTKATFFMVGRMAVADPEMVRRVAAEGHTVAAHTWSHKNLGKISAKGGVEEIEMGITAVTRALGHPMAPFFRFPYLSESRATKEHLRSRDLSSWWIDVDSIDYRTQDPSVVQRRVMQRVEKAGKGIILLHDIQRSTARAMPGLLAELHAKGYKVVHVVPKSGASTVADFDASVDRAFAAKSKSSKAAPLADRAVTWSTDSAASVRATGSVAEVEELPWAKAPTNRPAPARPPRPAAPAKEELPWQPQLFGY